MAAQPEPIDVASREVDPETGEIAQEPAVASTEVVVPATMTRAVTPVSEGGILVQHVPTGELLKAQEEYEDLCRKLLDQNDYQTIGTKDFKKKSAWRKLAIAFGVSVRLVDEDYTPDQRGRIVRARIRVVATAPNGRSFEGIGVCSVFERCCEGEGVCRIRTRYEDSGNVNKNHPEHCTPDCPGSIHFSHAEHDVTATAMTRATNRACADLFGLGEVSAEEVEGGAQAEDNYGEAAAERSRPARRGRGGASKGRQGSQGSQSATAAPSPPPAEDQVAELRWRISRLPDEPKAWLKKRWEEKASEGRLPPVTETRALTARQLPFAKALVDAAEAKAKQGGWTPSAYPGQDAATPPAAAPEPAPVAQSAPPEGSGGAAAPERPVDPEEPGDAQNDIYDDQARGDVDVMTPRVVAHMMNERGLAPGKDVDENKRRLAGVLAVEYREDAERPFEDEGADEGH